MVHRHRHHHHAHPAGKKIVYITPHRAAAIESLRDYQKKGETGGIEREKDATGQMIFVVYIYPRV